MNRKNNIIVVIIIALAFIYLFFPMLTGTSNFFNEDNSDVFYPCKETIRLSLKNGEFPLWTPLRFSGHSFIEEPQAQLFYPFTWLFIKFPAHIEIDYSTIIHILLGFFFMYRLCRKLNLSGESSLFGAALYIFSGFFAQAYKDANYGTISTSIWLPLVITELLLYFRTRAKKYFITAVFANVLMFFAGHLNFFYINQFVIIIFILTYNLKFNFKSAASRLIKPLFFYLSVIILILPLFFAGLNMARNSARVNRGGLGYTTNLSISPDQLLMFFLENPYGYDSQTFFGPNTTMWQGYTGSLALLLIFVCGCKRKFKLKIPLLIMICTAFFMAFGKYNPLFVFAYKFIPGVSFFRAPQRYLLIYIFAVSLFSAYSLNFILKRKCSFSKLKISVIISSALLAVVLLLTVNIFKNETEKFIIEIYKYIQNSGFKRSWLTHSINNGLPVNFNLTLSQALFKFSTVLLCGFTALLILKRHPEKKKYLFIILFCILIIELLPLNKQLLNMSLRRFDDMKPHKNLFTEIAKDNEISRMHSVFSCGYAQHIMFNRQDILGRTATMYDDYQTFLGMFGLRAMELLNVKYILINKGWFEEYKKKSYIFFTDPETGNQALIPKNYKPRIYGINSIEFANGKNDELLKIHNNISDIENDTAVLSAEYSGDFNSLHFNPSTLNIKNIKINFNSILFTAESDTEQFIILSELYYKDWAVCINGQKSKIYRANYVFRGVKTQAGKNEIILKYKPFYFYIYSLISFCAFIIFLYFMIFKGSKLKENSKRL